jgi:hypothetical protein
MDVHVTRATHEVHTSDFYDVIELDSVHEVTDRRLDECTRFVTLVGVTARHHVADFADASQMLGGRYLRRSASNRAQLRTSRSFESGDLALTLTLVPWSTNEHKYKHPS